MKDNVQSLLDKMIIIFGENDYETLGGGIGRRKVALSESQTCANFMSLTAAN